MLDLDMMRNRNSPKNPEVVEEEDFNTDKLNIEEVSSDTPDEEIDSIEESRNDDSSGIEGDNSCDDGEDLEDSSNHHDYSTANPGWADAMKKVLSIQKSKRKKTIVLSKAKKLNDVIIKEKKQLPFQIEGEDGKIKIDEEIKGDDSVEVSVTKSEHKRQRRKDQILGIRIKPSVLDREKERILHKIATKGVVQLFNAVKQQQTDIDKKLEYAGPVERKREKVLKSIDRKSFLDVLMGGTNSIAVEEILDENKKEEHDATTNKDAKMWSVLRDDFVMGAKLKDWNKKASNAEDSSAAEEMDSDNE